jgi:SIR2-like domain
MALSPDEVTLRTFLDQPDAAIFVGSGLSAWSKLPNWEVLLRKLIDIAAAKGGPTQLAEEALASKQLLEAADALELTPIEIANAMRGPLGFSVAVPHMVHSLLVRLGPQRFVTTNYDTLIEQQLGLDGNLGRFRTVTSRQVAELADIMKASADSFVFKPHGDLADANSIVLTTRDYDRLIAGETNELFALFANKLKHSKFKRRVGAAIADIGHRGLVPNDVVQFTLSTKLSTTRFSPALSNWIVSLLPSIAVTLPLPNLM